MSTQIRNNDWLKDRIEAVYKRYFSDVEIKNRILVRFGRKARYRLGSIKWGPKPRRRGEDRNTFITLTGHFQDERVPESVIDTTLAHELAHYAHGFCSPHPQLHEYPHQHGVVDRELTQRGLGDNLKLQKRWLNKHWWTIVRSSRRKRK